MMSPYSFLILYLTPQNRFFANLVKTLRGGATGDPPRASGSILTPDLPEPLPAEIKRYVSFL